MLIAGHEITLNPLSSLHSITLVLMWYNVLAFILESNFYSDRFN